MQINTLGNPIFLSSEVMEMIIEKVDPNVKTVGLFLKVSREMSACVKNHHSYQEYLKAKKSYQIREFFRAPRGQMIQFLNLNPVQATMLKICGVIVLIFLYVQMRTFLPPKFMLASTISIVIVLATKFYLRNPYPQA